MQRLYYELEILSRAINYKNLSAAALHVGLSQPQLSRIIGKIEEELKVVLLDRSAKRKSAWTPIAQELAHAFERNLGRLVSEIQNLTQENVVSELRIGTLEGLTGEAMRLTKLAFKEIGIRQITLDILDLSALEAQFGFEHLDLVLTSKFPSRQKFKHSAQIGYQEMEVVKTKSDTLVLSSFEQVRTNKKTTDIYKNILVSNSLWVKKQWLREMGGTGSIPTEMKKGNAKDKEPVYVIASDLMSPTLWNELEKLFARI